MIAGCSGPAKPPAPAGPEEAILAKMSLDEKIGQLFMPGFNGREMNDTIRDAVVNYRLGGFIFMAPRNVLNRKQAARLTADIQSLAKSTGTGIPLLFSIDQEGGIGSHINMLTGGVDTPGNLALGAAVDPHVTYLSYKIMSDDLNAYGIHMALAPVLDLLINKGNTMNHVRSFGSDAEKVSARAAESVRGLQDNGSIACVKHFPGKGETTVDSHKSAPVNRWDRAKCEKTILAPFRAAIEAGADSVMIGHEIYEGLDAKNVATVSKKIITGLLKKEMGFEGLVITDSITMGGVTKSMDAIDASVLAIAAGADMILFAGDSPNNYIKGTAAMKAALESGKLDMERIDDAVRRILRVKIKYGLFEEKEQMPPPVYANLKKENLKLSRDLARKTIAIVKNEGGLLPLDRDKADRYLLVTPKTFFTVPLMESLFPIGTTLGIKVKKIAPEIRLSEFDLSTIELDTRQAIERSRDADVIIVGTILAYFSDEISGMVRQLKATGKPVVVVGLSVPYDLEKFPDVDAFICSFSPRSVSLEAVAEALFGKFEPEGELPVGVDM